MMLGRGLDQSPAGHVCVSSHTCLVSVICTRGTWRSGSTVQLRSSWQRDHFGVVTGGGGRGRGMYLGTSSHCKSHPSESHVCTPSHCNNNPDLRPQALLGVPWLKD